MLFHTTQFLIFFVIVYSLYRVLPHRWQNLLLLAGSYIFYGAWEWRYLSLILFSTTVDYFVGRLIQGSESKAKAKKFVYLSVFVNISLLCVFKYYDFFAANFQTLMAQFGLEVHPYFLNVALPIGISFYTFQTISYSVDVYRGKLKACRNYFDFALYVSFFPQLVAGPIERGVRLLPQIINPRNVTTDDLMEGLYAIMWGLFMKVVIADNLADIVIPVFDGTDVSHGGLILVAIYSFAIQVFCDFSGYSLMAIGLAKMMGITLMDNFQRPYFTKNISDFWRKWHISLSSWFRDYVFSPYYIYLQKRPYLKGFSMGQKHAIAFFATLFITEFLLGLWHGAGWNYAFFGVFHAVLIWAYYYTRKPWDKMNGLLQTLLSFQLVCVGWLIFRSSSLEQSWDLFLGLFSGWNVEDETFVHALRSLVFLTLPLLVHELWAEKKDRKYVIMLAPTPVQIALYSMIIGSMIVFGQFGEKKFIYFQF